MEALIEAASLLLRNFLIIPTKYHKLCPFNNLQQTFIEHLIYTPLTGRPWREKISKTKHIC